MADEHADAQTSGSLAGYLVVDISRALAGPHAAMMLGDMGADVIKVEPPGGDESRVWGPPFVGPEEDPIATYYLSANRNKRSISLDLKTDQGRETLRSLLTRADVLVENFRPGVLDRLGFPPEVLAELNPGLVTLSITGFGHDGPQRDRPGYDQIAQGEGGLMSMTGPGADQPTKMGVPIADVLAGMYGAFGAAAALADRERTGKGAVVRTSLLAAAVGAHAFQGTRWTVGRDVPRPQGNHHPAIAPYGAFRCADGQIQVAVGNQGQWRRFAATVGMDPDEPRFATNTDRITNHAALVEAMEQALGARGRDEWLPLLEQAGVPSGAIRTLDEVYASEQVRSQELVVDVDHPVLGAVELPGPPLRGQRVDGTSITRTGHRAPPLLDEHADEIRSWLGE
jgi:crotonobetainyl-CoA:carnitine CoA-transferase CaiB-like acyl-CoA transferase